MTLIEVLVASLLVGVVAIGTFSAFDAAGQSTADTRAHAQATQLAAQDEERLRDLSTEKLAQLGSTEQLRAENGICLAQTEKEAKVTYSYWNQANTSFCEKNAELAGKAYTGTIFTVTSSARYVAAEKGTEKAEFTCEKTGGAANYLQTTSSVRWPSLHSRLPVSQSSIVTLPTSAVLVVKVLSQNNEPVEGATVTATGLTSEITPASGCVIWGGLSPKTVEVTASKANWVEKDGKSPAKNASVTLTSNTVTEVSLTLGEPGKIVAEFESNGKTETEKGTEKEKITGDTFYALQTEMTSPPDFVGGTDGTYSSTATLTGTEGKGLFPFVKVGKPPGEAPYTVFAGDCEANNPAKVTETGEKLKDRTAQVNPNGEPHVKVEVPAVSVTVYEGTKEEVTKSEKADETPKYVTNPESIDMINAECSSATAQNEAPVPYKHQVTLNSKGELAKGKWEPYSKKLEFCVSTKTGTKAYYKYDKAFENTAKAGHTIGAVYLKSETKTETLTACP
jgi:Tfp pilus assembly protein PilV